MLITRVALALTFAAALALAGCSSGDEQAADAPSPASTSSPAVEESPSIAASASPSPSPSVTPGIARPTAPPSQSVDAGTVADGTSASVSGEGPAEIAYVREGELAVVIALDCSACTGPTVLTAPERMSPHDEAEGPLEGSYLVDVFVDDAPEQSFWLVADGEWTIDLSSWNDLPPTEGAVEGTGSTVLLFVDDSASSLVTWEPAGEGDSFMGRYFGVSDQDAVSFGDGVAFSERMDIQRPGALAIRTEGAWKIEP